MRNAHALISSAPPHDPAAQLSLENFDITHSSSGSSAYPQAENFPGVDDCSQPASQLERSEQLPGRPTATSQSYYAPMTHRGRSTSPEDPSPFRHDTLGAQFPAGSTGPDQSGRGRMRVRLVFVLSHKQDVLHFRKLIAVFQDIVGGRGFRRCRSSFLVRSQLYSYYCRN